MRIDGEKRDSRPYWTAMAGAEPPVPERMGVSAGYGQSVTALLNRVNPPNGKRWNKPWILQAPPRVKERSKSTAAQNGFTITRMTMTIMSAVGISFM